MRRPLRTLGCLARPRGALGACTYTSRAIDPPDARGDRVVDALQPPTARSCTPSTPRRTARSSRSSRSRAHVRDAVIAIEDERFYRHNGVDPRAILRAARTNVEAGDIEQGGSTITQQYVKQEILEDDSPTFERKLQEASTGDPARAPLLQGPHPRAVPERHLLRERRLRDRGGRPPVLREAGHRPHPRGGRAPRRAHPAAGRHRPLRRARGRRWSAATLVLERMLANDMITDAEALRPPGSPGCSSRRAWCRPPSATRRRTSSRR